MTTHPSGSKTAPTTIIGSIYEESLKVHELHQGVLEVASKVPLKTVHDLSVDYTPGVAEPCREIANNEDDVYTYTSKGNLVAVVTDGSAVLGLGNIGAHAAMPVMEGKAIIFKTLGGVDAFPICIDTNDTEEIIKTVKHIAPTFGGINLEDIVVAIRAEETYLNGDQLPNLADLRSNGIFGVWFWLKVGGMLMNGSSTAKAQKPTKISFEEIVQIIVMIQDGHMPYCRGKYPCSEKCDLHSLNFKICEKHRAGVSPAKNNGRQRKGEILVFA